MGRKTPEGRPEPVARARGSRRWWMDSRLILALIATQACLLRLFAVVKHEVMLHEYDPYFNYKCAEFIAKHGLTQFWHAVDEGSWYPFGRRVGQTVYPGLMIVAYAMHSTLQYIGVDIALKTVCVLLPAAVSAATVYAVYHLSREIAENEAAALTAAFFLASMPALLSRTAAGAFDNEAIAICLMVVSMHAWLAATKRPSIGNAARAALPAFLMALSWGGYVFVLNAIAAFTVAAIVLRVEANRVAALYVVYHPLTVALCYAVPMISHSVMGALEMRLTHAALLVAAGHLAVERARAQRPNWAPHVVAAAAAPIVWLIVVVNIAQQESSLTARLGALFSPENVATDNPLVASISEHQPTRWTSMVLDLWVALLYAPIGLHACFKRGIRLGKLVLAIYAIIASYFAAAMVRLGLVLAPAAAMLSGMGVAHVLEWGRGPSKERDLDKGVAKSINVALGALPYIVTAALMMAHVTHSTWVASTIYANPNVMISWHADDGERRVADDFRDAYSWIRNNTDKDAVIMAWWDYGYQLKQMANRTVLTDNNTSNYQQIAITGMVRRIMTKAQCTQIFASQEAHAHKMLLKLNVDYVMVVYGGIAKFEMDDISKFPWMTRIAAKEFPQVHRSRFAGGKTNKFWQDTLLYRLCYHGVQDVSEYDAVRKTKIDASRIQLQHFTEAFTSENWVVRVYRVKDAQPHAHATQ